MSPKEAATRILALPRPDRLKALDEALGHGPTPLPTSGPGGLKLAWNAELVTALRLECDRRNIATPWSDGQAVRGRGWRD